VKNVFWKRVSQTKGLKSTAMDNTKKGRKEKEINENNIRDY